jgi:hypothetical protein
MKPDDSITHLSYSQYNSYVSCPRSWYLGKKVRAEEKQTWFLPVGTAVHTMIEHKLKAPAHLGDDYTFLTAEDFFFPLIEEQMLIEPDTSKWLSGSANGVAAVDGVALQQVKDCFEKALEFLEQMDVWEVEYDASGPLPGCDVEIKAFVDILGEHKKHGPVILDWKTGSQKPKTPFQLETYAALLHEQGWRLLANSVGSSSAESSTFKGLWAMLKPGASKARPIDLSGVKPEEVGAKYQEVLDQMRKRVYATDPAKFKCEFCFHSENCLVNAGPTDRAKFFDRSSRDGIPFDPDRA